MAKPPSGRKRRESSSSSGAAAIKADPEEDEQAATTNGKNTTNASGANGLIFKEEVLNRRVQVLFDVDTGKDDEPMAHQWYEGTITAVQLEPANAKANAGAGGGGKRGGRRGAKSKSDESSTNGTIKLKATHQVTFDDGDVRWFDLVYWTGKGELKWVGDAPTPVSHPTIDPNAGSKTVGNGTEESTTASSQKESADTSGAAPLNAQQDGAAVKTSPLVSPNGKRNAAENNNSSVGEPLSPAKKKSKAAAPPQQESLPHTLIHGTKYYIV